jgi:hypothetical protein
MCNTYITMTVVLLSTEAHNTCSTNCNFTPPAPSNLLPHMSYRNHATFLLYVISSDAGAQNVIPSNWYS